MNCFDTAMPMLKEMGIGQGALWGLLHVSVPQHRKNLCRKSLACMLLYRV
jgi:hypothetical protein